MTAPTDDLGPDRPEGRAAPSGGRPLPPGVEALIEKMDRNPEIRAAIRAHLIAQQDVDPGFLRLDNGQIVEIGEGPE